MTLKYTIITAFHGLRTNKSRSALTILGIVIGIAAIIVVMSVGQGAQNLILSQIQGLGSTTVVIESGREPKGPSDFAEIFSDSLKLRDLEALKDPSNVSGIEVLSPIVVYVGTVAYANETQRPTIRGASNVVAKILDIVPEEGQFFTDDDIKQNARVAVIGSRVKDELFGFTEAVGKKIKIKNQSFRIVGVFPEKGQAGIFDVDKMVFVPYTTAQKYLLGSNFYQAIVVQAKSEEDIPRLVSDIKLTLRENHGIEDPTKDDFHVMTQADVVDRIGTVGTILTVLLVSIAAISLLVGGIGIMNIMLVSVTERTREIGLRKALGATDQNILIQFLFEAVMLTGIGGAVGITSGTLFSYLASLILTNVVSLKWAFTFPIDATIIGLIVSASIGLIFGLYPARQASFKNPIEALRYE